jgi:2-amino-4-hydroxy-6-hydroxymethyldihydropteridine diphosphokinase
MADGAIAKDGWLFIKTKMTRHIASWKVLMSRPSRSRQVETLLLALGANATGLWGPPGATLHRVLEELKYAGVTTVRASNLYSTRPLGYGLQARYLNAVLLAKASMSPGQLLRLVKQIERRAGRTHTRAMAPRALDIDILDFGGRRMGWPPCRRERGRLTLPHPELHRRAFVLVPLLDVAPAWRHPVLGAKAKALLSRLPATARAGVVQALDFSAPACNKQQS